jgi:uncharacterized protein YegL
LGPIITAMGFLITDGQPTDMRKGDGKWERSYMRSMVREHDHKFLFWALGVDQANMNLLREISPRVGLPYAQGGKMG